MIDTVGYNYVKMFHTPGCRIRHVTTADGMSGNEYARLVPPSTGNRGGARL
jgi:hypothetical protein